MAKKETEKFLSSNIFEGMTSISALIKSIRSGNNDREISKILFDSSKVKSKHAEYSFLKAVSREIGFELSLVDSQEISELSVGNTHGGIIAICGDRIIQNLSLDKIKDNGIYFMLEGAEDPYNFGNAIRSIYAAGADGIIVGERNWLGAAGIVAKSSAGTSELIDIYKVSDATNAIELFKQAGYTVACAGIRDSVDIFEASLNKPLFVVIGGEKRGISRSVLDMADVIVRIGYGNEFKGSLSMSAAASVFVFEIFRKNHYLE